MKYFSLSQWGELTSETPLDYASGDYQTEGDVASAASQHNQVHDAAKAVACRGGCGRCGGPGHPPWGASKGPFKEKFSLRNM